jgi:hypothetical protein
VGEKKKLAQDSEDREARTRQPGQDSRWTAGIGQPGQDSRDRTVRTGKPGQDSGKGKPEMADGIQESG